MYHKSSLGASLREAISAVFFPQPEYYEENVRPAVYQFQDLPSDLRDLQEKVMAEFDEVLKRKFEELPTSTAHMKTKLFGECTDYNNFEDVWRFKLGKCEVKGEGMHEMSCKMLVVAMDKNIETVPIKASQSTPKRTKMGGKRCGRRGGRGGMR